MFYFGHCLEKFIGCWRFSICSIFSVIVVKKTVTGCSLGWAFCAGLFSWQSKIKSRKKRKWSSWQKKINNILDFMQRTQLILKCFFMQPILTKNTYSKIVCTYFVQEQPFSILSRGGGLWSFLEFQGPHKTKKKR